MEPYKHELDLIPLIERASESLSHYANVLKGVEEDLTGCGIRMIATTNVEILLGYLKRISGLNSEIV